MKMWRALLLAGLAAVPPAVRAQTSVSLNPAPTDVPSVSKLHVPASSNSTAIAGQPCSTRLHASHDHERHPHSHAFLLLQRRAESHSSSVSQHDLSRRGLAQPDRCRGNPCESDLAALLPIAMGSRSWRMGGGVQQGATIRQPAHAARESQLDDRCRVRIPCNANASSKLREPC